METYADARQSRDFEATNSIVIRGRLLPELHNHVHEIDGRLWLVHPLLDAVPLDAKELSVVNRRFRQRAAQAAAYEREGDWFGYVMCHDRPLVFETFLRVADRIRDDDYWQTLRQLISTVGDCSADAPILAQLLTANRPGRERLMTARERAALEAMPDPLTVFRISEAEMINGWNWRLSRDEAVAASHAIRRQPPTFLLASGSVRRADVIAYLPEFRREGEILADPHCVAADLHWL